ncbi:ABC transporter ATP-binding protein [Ketogulonicigenium vulgare]|uniref:Oligopeptide/dipeptide ABC transporter, ATPase subunit n=1 Tax=Ketogulonicigenium vulgare (strain WSH-001) TaxID=759362 RepID=F9Y5X9_KETVW|nr:ABC transporter ATP-binding protein [Ketogulonicigenium vulgare]ADO42613.1 oligopeptide/dipeptide ABC transporter, ATP-binding protein [Ketogulonicigenium vulgare Y25]AEM40804.1 Oligopeptide/dipeptide ABC transporter, ATPase subunit [Ketogulonicigenium vulgare WSH-001]ALJ80969.1 methionine ABC transporter ATP-binding protein [Ketogulonicigenium vulgare]ANW33734.1 methionine ABC transporter ATP-binding protein [Ketogulonicigenium vulgare]AOZ54522.1 oligopeptide/dipeptide ABC transporter ATP-
MTKTATKDLALQVAGLNVRFKTLRGVVEAVSDVSFDLPSGSVLALVGESGSGKSVTAKSIMGLVRANHAEVSTRTLQLCGQDLKTMSEEGRRRLRGAQIAMVFQDALSALNPVLSIADQLGELFRIHRQASRREARERAIELLRLVRIPNAEKRVDDYPHQFSGGMRQRLLIAAGIALKPQVLIADEPTTALDVTVQAQILDLLDELRSAMGMSVMIITHDLGVVARIAEEVAVMYGGRIVERAGVEEIFDAPRHPYTAALLASAPRISSRARLTPIQGTTPVLINPKPGCAFAPRCAYATPICVNERPLLTPDGAPHCYACHHPMPEVEHA